jgi:hypothetical protein
MVNGNGVTAVPDGTHLWSETAGSNPADVALGPGGIGAIVGHHVGDEPGVFLFHPKAP